MKKLRARLTYANVMATIAVFIALGGASYAATQLPKNSVGSKQLKQKSVKAGDIATGAVTLRTIADSVKGIDVGRRDEGEVRTSPVVTMREKHVEHSRGASSSCLPGELLVGGGGSVFGSSSAGRVAIEASYPYHQHRVFQEQPSTTADTWNVISNLDGSKPLPRNASATAVALCADFRGVSTGTQGPVGPQGIPGPQGPEGPTGLPPDESCPEGTYVSGIKGGKLACTSFGIVE